MVRPLHTPQPPAAARTRIPRTAFLAYPEQAVQALARAGLRNPVRVNVAVAAAAGKKAKKRGAKNEGNGGEDDGTQVTPSTLQLQVCSSRRCLCVFNPPLLLLFGGHMLALVRDGAPRKASTPR